MGLKKFKEFVNEDHAVSREDQIQFIMDYAPETGYTDLPNEEFLRSLSDSVIETYYDMLENIRKHKDDVNPLDEE